MSGFFRKDHAPKREYAFFSLTHSDIPVHLWCANCYIITKRKGNRIHYSPVPFIIAFTDCPFVTKPRLRVSVR